MGRKLSWECMFVSLRSFLISGCAHFPCCLQLWEPEPSILKAICNILELEPSILNAICNILSLELSFPHAICSILEPEPSILLASCNIWELEPSILHDICICLQHVGAGIFYLACYLQVVVGCWLLSVSCGFLFVLLFLLQ